MKKMAIPLVIALVMGVSLAAYAGATKSVLDPSHAEDGTTGFVVINDADVQKTIFQFQIRGGGPGKSYWGYYWKDDSYSSLGKFKMNKSGSGHLHSYVKPPLTPPYYVGVSDKNPGDMDWPADAWLHQILAIYVSS